ncbi:MAG: ABC transporter permease [Flavobacteriales bacterium]
MLGSASIGRAALQAALTLLGITIVMFLLFSVLPGDPARLMAGRHANDDQVELIRKDMGLDQPVPVQFAYFLNDLSPFAFVREEKTMSDWEVLVDVPIGETHMVLKWPYFRRSYVNGVKVGDLIKEGFPETFVLAISAIFVALLIGIPLGIKGARNPGSWIDQGISIMSSAGLAVPSFLLAILIGWVFGYLLSDYTGLKMTGSLFTYDVYQGKEVLTLQNIVLPALTLSIRPICVMSQLMRESMTTVLSADYIRTARAKGLKEDDVIYKHALINALSPTVTASATWLAALLAGSVFVEYVFGWNGLGQVIVKAIEFQDFPVIIGLTLVISLSFVVINWLLTFIYPMLDPRLRTGN